MKDAGAGGVVADDAAADDADPEVGSCPWARERLELHGYGDLEADEAVAVEAHLEGCAGCREGLAACTRLRADLDRLPVPRPTSAAWACLEARLETRVAPIRARRLALGDRGAFRWRWARRVAAALLVAGLGLTSARLYQENARQQRRLVAVARDLADLKFVTGDVRGAYEGYAFAVRAGTLTGVGAARYAVKDRVLALPPRLPALWALARRAAADEQARLLTEVLWDFPDHPFADEAYVALRSIRRHHPARLRPLEAVADRALGVLRSAAGSGAGGAQHLRAEVERLLLEAEERTAAVRVWVWLRAGRIAETDLKDPAFAATLYRRVTAQTGVDGPVRDYAVRRLEKLAARR